jgi:hypothetical protein
MPADDVSAATTSGSDSFAGKMDPMGNSTEAVRQTIHAALAARGCDLETLQETILIRGGMYCGRRFQGSHGSAVWFVEENQIKYFGADGALLEAIAAPAGVATPAPVRRAA